jgi:endoglucanase
MFKITILTFILLIFFSSSAELRGEPSTSTGFIHTRGSLLVDGSNQAIRLRGLGFGNEVWSNPSIAPEYHHREQDYSLLAALNMNCIRFYLNYRLFESDDNPFIYREEGFAWLDQNFEWARRNGIYLIINMHVPQGGFQSLGQGEALWTNRDIQLRFISLWREIAKRYKDEPMIAGYDLLNEPVTTENVEQWQVLAEETVQTIRQVDKNHLIIIERVNSAVGDENINQNGQMNFFLVNDDNVMYQFHFYEDPRFSHQGVNWVAGLTELDHHYPDDEWLILNGNEEWIGTSYWNPQLNNSSSGLVNLEGTWYTHDTTDDLNKDLDQASVIYPSIQAKNLGNSGQLELSFVKVEKKSPSGITQTLWEWEPNQSTLWYFWSQDESGAGTVKDTGIFISGTNSEAAMMAVEKPFLLEEGWSYRISGTVEAKDQDPSAVIKVRLDFFSFDAPVGFFTKSYLCKQFEQYVRFGVENDVPLFLGEFGLVAKTFTHNRGGDRWFRDVFELINEAQLHYTIHGFHDDEFGLYLSNASSIPPRQEDLNEPLLDSILQELGGYFPRNFE